jgi:uncharacterized protein YhaN
VTKRRSDRPALVPAEEYVKIRAQIAAEWDTMSEVVQDQTVAALASAALSMGIDVADVARGYAAVEAAAGNLHRSLVAAGQTVDPSVIRNAVISTAAAIDRDSS